MRQTYVAARNDEIILRSDEDRLQFWTPKDPYAVTEIDTGPTWLHDLIGSLLCFKLDTRAEALFWLWGAATAVRTDLEIDLETPQKEVVVCNGAAFVTLFGPTAATPSYTLYLLPLLSERVEGALPAMTLPLDAAPLVQMRQLCSGLLKPVIVAPVGSEVHSPLIFLGSEVYELVSA